MTTIAYKDGVIATDGQTTSGRMVVRTNTEKRRETDSAVYFFAGSDCSIDELINALETGETISGECDANVFMVKDGKVYLCGAENGGAYVSLIHENEPSAIGSGYEFAMGAMAAGCTAKQAVKIAASLDIYTGGKIRTYKV